MSEVKSEEDASAKRKREDEEDIAQLRATERRMQRDLAQHRRRESLMVLKLALKDRENAELQQQLRELRTALHPSHSQTTTLLLDPAVNAEIMRLREELKEAQAKEKEAQDEVQAMSFQSGSIAGKKLIQKCKDLQAENDQLGRDLSEGRAKKLLADQALQKDYSTELNKALLETREWVEQLLEEVDTSQALVLKLKKEVNELKKQPKLSPAKAEA